MSSAMDILSNMREELRESNSMVKNNPSMGTTSPLEDSLSALTQVNDILYGTPYEPQISLNDSVVSENQRENDGIRDEDEKYPWTHEKSTKRNKVKTHISDLARVKKEMKALEIKYFKLKQSNDRMNLKMDKHVAEIRRVRQENYNQEKTLHSKTVLLTRLHEEKIQIEKQAIANREYAKRIEQKLAMGAKGQAMAERNEKLNQKMKALEGMIDTQNGDLQEKAREIEGARNEINLLSRALEVRMKELGLDGDPKAGLLYQLACARKENNVLASKLSSVEDQLQHEKSTVTAQRLELDERESVHAELETLMADIEQKIFESEQERTLVVKERNDLLNEKKMMLVYIQELADKNIQMEKSFEDMRLQKNILEEKMQRKIDQSKEKLLALSENLEEERKKTTSVQQVLKITEEALASEHKANQSLRGDIQKSTQENNTLIEKMEMLSSENDHLTAVNKEFKAKLDSRNDESEALSKKVEELQGALLEKSVALEKHNNVEKALRQEMESALKDIEKLSMQRDEAARAMNEAVTISARSLHDQQVIESKVAEQVNEIESLKKSKQLIEKAMLDQLTALRQQLHLERSQRLELEGGEAVVPKQKNVRSTFSLLPKYNHPEGKGSLASARRVVTESKGSPSKENSLLTTTTSASLLDLASED